MINEVRLDFSSTVVHTAVLESRPAGFLSRTPDMTVMSGGNVTLPCPLNLDIFARRLVLNNTESFHYLEWHKSRVASAAAAVANGSTEEEILLCDIDRGVADPSRHKDQSFQLVGNVTAGNFSLQLTNATADRHDGFYFCKLYLIFPNEELPRVYESARFHLAVEDLSTWTLPRTKSWPIVDDMSLTHSSQNYHTTYLYLFERNAS